MHRGGGIGRSRNMDMREKIVVGVLGSDTAVDKLLYGCSRLELQAFITNSGGSTLS